MEKEQSVWDIGGRQDQGELFQALETLAYFTEPSLPTAFLHHTHPVARKRKEQYQQGKTETATASSAEVEPFLKFSRLHRPLTACPEGPPVLLFPPVRPLFSSCQPRRWETAEGRADNHGSTKQVTTEKHCDAGLSHSRSCALALAVTLWEVYQKHYLWHLGHHYWKSRISKDGRGLLHQAIKWMLANSSHST